ncbi:hypothetical protein BJF79_15170 [Actinomadura sp. CNU-125]|nr:hypothetical protein BJF79_15170 [Actinomadura sp. CNU-125]
MDGTAVATSGIPAPIASTSTHGSPSQRDAIASTSNAGSTAATSSRCPSQRIRSPIPSRSVSRSSSSAIGPPPTHSPNTSPGSRAIAFAKISGPFWNVSRPTDPTTFTPSGRSSRRRACAREPGAAAYAATSTAGHDSRTRSGVVSPSRSAVVTVSDPIARNASVRFAAIRSRPIYVRRRAHDWNSLNGNPCQVWTIRGTPARAAATRPITPPFALCVWTTS